MLYSILKVRFLSYNSIIKSIIILDSLYDFLKSYYHNTSYTILYNIFNKILSNILRISFIRLSISIYNNSIKK